MVGATVQGERRAMWVRHKSPTKSDLSPRRVRRRESDWVGVGGRYRPTKSGRCRGASRRQPYWLYSNSRETAYLKPRGADPPAAWCSLPWFRKGHLVHCWQENLHLLWIVAAAPGSHLIGIDAPTLDNPRTFNTIPNRLRFLIHPPGLQRKKGGGDQDQRSTRSPKGGRGSSRNYCPFQQVHAIACTVAKCHKQTKVSNH